MNDYTMIYVAGPYRGGSEWATRSNIERAAVTAAQLWKEGAAVICPHLNTQFMGGIIPDEQFIDRDLVILERCDALFFMPGAENSRGANRERQHAAAMGIPILRTVNEAREFIERQAKARE